jgi:hypothetical protein
MPECMTIRCILNNLSNHLSGELQDIRWPYASLLQARI